MPNIHSHTSSADAPPADVVIIGGGLAGTLASILLARAGRQVALVDFHEVYPAELRAERIVGPHAELLDRLGLLKMLVQDMVPAKRTVAMRAGRVVDAVAAPHYGVLYDEMVNRARRHIPPSVRHISGKAVDVALSKERQRVTLADGQIIEGRLVMLATGLGLRLARQLGISRTMVHRAHSITYGFDIEVESASLFRSSVLVAYGEQAAGALDFLTVFPLEDTIRANLFGYGDHRDDWTKGFMHEPLPMLRQAMPRLEQVTGRINAIAPVQMRVTDLATASDYLRDGMVLIGDAFQTTCPATGTGVGRLLTDIDRLCNHYLPRWLATPGMDAAKIGEFYQDEAKKKCDGEAMRSSLYRRSLVTETGLRWRVHRQRVALQNRLRLARRRLRPGGGAELAWGEATLRSSVEATL